MNPSWEKSPEAGAEPFAGGCEFTLRHYREILVAARERFEILRLEQSGELADGRRQLILRHDIDFSPPDALRMAQLEAELGVRASYCVLLHSPSYHLGEPETLAALREVAALGHEIALHYDLSFFEAAGIEPRAGIEREAGFLGETLGVTVRSVAQHMPGRHGRFEGAGERFIDAYDPRLLARVTYLSDSRRAWRAGCLHARLAGLTQAQVLIHPEWWEAGAPCTRRETVERLARGRQRAIGDWFAAYADQMDAAAPPE